jgi:D-alanyl-D-alanine carboxypeptidase (penicillin-binding protein 5/6)
VLQRSPSLVSPRRPWVVAGCAAVAALALIAALTAARLIRHGADARHHYLAADGWPATGQAAYQLGRQPARTSPGERPVPIASLAKVMTAYLVLRDFPLHGGSDGPSLTVTRADVRDTSARRRTDQSIVPVAAGETLTERQALLALLLPSANNVAAMLARFDAGTQRGFVADMNQVAHTLGMLHTHYTDPSGYDPATTSTAADQLLLARAVAHDASFDELVATRTAQLPGAGVVTNTDILLGTDGFVGTKTGSDDQAGSCFMFRAFRNVHDRLTQILGVVLGQPGRNLVVAGQYAARQLVDRVAPDSAAA